jgi:glycerophosphoryl diester phosphodiesterase
MLVLMLVVAHRSPRSATACRAAADAGATVFEIDVQIWHGKLVVSHYLPVGGTPFRRDGWRFAVGWSERREPPLERVASVVPDQHTVLLDLKENEPGRRRALVEAIVDTLPNSGRYIACSPLVDDINALREKGFRTWRTIGDQGALNAVFDVGELADEAVTVDHRLLSQGSVERLHRHTSTVVAWTVNDVGRLLTLRGWGVDGVTTDRIEVMRAAQDGNNSSSGC